MNSIRTTGHAKLETVQSLRALAALMVAIAHAAEEAKYFFHLDPGFDSTPLGKGVDIFFVISGFIIYYSSRNLFGTSEGVRHFAFNRLVRVVPLYYLATTLMVLTLLLFPAGIKQTQLDWGQIVSSYFFFPYARYDGRIAPVLSLGWTLNYEMFFYAAFAGVMWLGKRRAIIIMLGLFALLAIIGAFLPASAAVPLRFWMSDIILEFVMGILLAIAFERHGKAFARGNAVPAACIVLGLVALYVLNLQHPPIDLPRFLSAGVPAALIVGAAVLLLPQRVEDRMPKLVSALGDSSYSLYLSHRFIQRPIQILAHKAMPLGDMAGWVYLFAAVVAAVIGAHLVYLFVEKPLLRRLRRREPAKDAT